MIFYMKITVTILARNLVTSFTSIPFLSFHRNQNQESNFQQVGSLITRNRIAFCLYRVALYFKDIPNSIGFYKMIFVHAIPVRIIVPC